MAIPPWITCSGGNSSISIFGSGSKWLLSFLQLFLEGGYLELHCLFTLVIFDFHEGRQHDIDDVCVEFC